MATTIKIKNIPQGYQSLITNGKHSIVGDEPISSKGTDLGLAPTELVLAGIAMCKVTTIRSVARRNGWEIGDVDAELSQRYRRDADGVLKTRVTSAISIDGDFTVEQRELLIQEADNCFVTRLVSGEWEFEGSSDLVEVETSALAA